MNILKKLFKRLCIEISKLIWQPSSHLIDLVKLDLFNIVVWKNEDVGRHIKLFRSFETEESLFFEHQIKADDICFDVGGNVGYFTLLFSKLAKNGSVHTFEPIQRNVLLIKLNSSINNLNNIYVNECLLGDESKNIGFSVSTDSAYSSINSTKRVRDSHKIEAKMLKLDDYVAERNVAKVDVLKIDVEGAELLVLKGSSNLLTNVNKKPRLLLIELYDPNLEKYNTNKSEIIELMRTYGYAPFVIDSSLKCKSYNPVKHARYYNFIFKISL